MVRRHTPRLQPRHLLVSVALVLGSGAVTDLAPMVVQAAPQSTARPAVPTPLPFVLGDDTLADDAGAAITAWTTFILGNDREAFARFNRLRDSVATVAAIRLDIEPATMVAAWQAADSTHQLALLSAFTQLGVPYVHNAMRPGAAFDCSGLTSFAWSQVGQQMPHQSLRQITAVQRVARQQAQAGDIVWYPGHVMLYLGVGDAIIHAPLRGRNVEVGFIAARRSRWVRFGNPTFILDET